MTDIADGFFWYEAHAGHYCVIVIDESRTEKVGRRRRKWIREWHAERVSELRAKAREGGIVLPSNVRDLCISHTHLTECKL